MRGNEKENTIRYAADPAPAATQLRDPIIVTTLRHRSHEFVEAESAEYSWSGFPSLSPLIGNAGGRETAARRGVALSTQWADATETMPVQSYLWAGRADR